MIEDNGKGFDVNESSNGVGLMNMKQRISSIGGTLNLDSFPGKGTTVMIEVPVHASVPV